MATLGELKARVRAETNRDDLDDELSGALTLAIQRAIEFYADEKFWFNSTITTVTSGAGSIPVPASVRKVERLAIPALNITLQETTLTQLERGTLLPVNGIPRWYAYYNNALNVWPQPEQSFTFQIIGLLDLPLLTTGEDYMWSAEDPITGFGDSLTGQNAWTNEAQDLIAARARFTLMRDQFRDPEGAQLAQAAMTEAFDRLKRETARRLETPLRSNMVASTRFDIRCGF